MAANDYRGYLRNTADMEGGQPRFHPAQSSEPTYRPLIFGTLAIMGLLQVASSVAILLHLTGYLQEVDLSSASRQPIEEVQTEPIINALKDPRKRRCKTLKEGLPAAHLPIRAPVDYVKRGEQKVTMIHWDEAQGHLKKMDYHDGRLLVKEAGFYYVYAQTCFRFYNISEQEAAVPLDLLRNVQLIQYIYHEKHTSLPITSVLLMKTGSTMRWEDSQHHTHYNMYCAQQGRGVELRHGDGLYVNVSNAWMVDQEREDTYFGAIKLSN